MPPATAADNLKWKSNHELVLGLQLSTQSTHNNYHTEKETHVYNIILSGQQSTVQCLFHAYELNHWAFLSISVLKENAACGYTAECYCWVVIHSTYR